MPDLPTGTVTFVFTDIEGSTGISLRDLGEHRLKDLAHRQHLFQVVVADSPSEFPRLRSLEAVPNNLPVQLPTFIGRDRELATITQMLTGAHLLTLTGAGGTGKTRLALQVAADVLEQSEHGVWVIEFGTLTDRALVPQAVASTLGIREDPGRPLTPTLVDYLLPRSMLLLLDGCEHLVEACAGLAEALLRSCPRLRILATSRERLNVEGESVWVVPSLSLPDVQHLPPVEVVTQYEAVRLFIDRAAATEPSFALGAQNASAVALVCHRLDGIPLAIELAAVRVKPLSVEQIAARLDDRFRLLTAGRRTALQHHQTLRAMIDWSHDLLSNQERILLRRLSVFAGGFALEAAEAVCGADGIEAADIVDVLSHLVDKSLVLAEARDGETRYRLLETIRQYSQEKLTEAGEAATFLRRHANWFVALAEQADVAFLTWEAGPGIERLETEHDNLRAAMGWSTAQEEHADVALRLGFALRVFWFVRGYWSEGQVRVEAALAKAGRISTPARARAVYAAGFLAWLVDDYARAQPHLEESLALFRALDDRPDLVESLTALGAVASNLGNYARAVALLEEAVAISRELGDRPLVFALNRLAREAQSQGDTDRAVALSKEALALARQLGFQWSVPFTLSIMAEALCDRGDYARAAALCEEGLALSRRSGARFRISFALGVLARVAESQSDLERAVALLRESMTLLREAGDRRHTARCLDALARVALRQGMPERAARLGGAAEGLRDAIGTPLPPVVREPHAQTVFATRTALGEDAFARLWADGRAMTLDQAVAYALEAAS